MSARGIGRDSLLQRYSGWAPTGFDQRGAFLLDPEQSTWYVGPCLQTRDSGSLERANYLAMVAALESVDPLGHDHETHRFGHWGPGWYELAIAKDGSAAGDALESMARALADYPVLDEDRLSALESDDVEETWKACYAREWVRDLARAFRADNPTPWDEYAWEEAFGAVDAGAMRELFETARERCNVYWEHDDSGANVRLERVVSGVAAEDLEGLAGFVWPVGGGA